MRKVTDQYLEMSGEAYEQLIRAKQKLTDAIGILNYVHHYTTSNCAAPMVETALDSAESALDWCNKAMNSEPCQDE